MRSVGAALVFSAVLLLSHVSTADDAAIWLDLQVSHEMQGLVFQFPPVSVSHSEDRWELKNTPVVSTYSQEGSFLLVPETDFFGKKKNGTWLFFGAFDVLASVGVDQDANSGCQSLSLVFESSKAQVTGGDEHCDLSAQGWQLRVRYWRSANKAIVDESKKKSSWWDVKPASDKAKKRMNKI